MPDLLTFEGRKQRAKFRAWHRGTREADYMIGGFFDRYHAPPEENPLDLIIFSLWSNHFYRVLFWV